MPSKPSTFPCAALYSEHAVVILKNAFKEHGLSVGDKGTIIHIYEQPGGFEVEFVDAGGHTQVLTLGELDIALI